MEQARIGFAFCGSFCTWGRAVEALRQTAQRYETVIPIVSERGSGTDTRFGCARDFLEEMERICGRPVISTVVQAEPIGPKGLLDVLVICPCTGNTLAKLALGITDSTVTMAAKSHLRRGGAVVIALSTNDGLSASAKNIGALLDKKHVYFVPFGQDDPAGKPRSLQADFTQVAQAVEAARQGRQLQPILLGCPAAEG